MQEGPNTECDTPRKSIRAARARKRNRKRRGCTISRRARSFPAVARESRASRARARGMLLPTVAMRGAFAVFRAGSSGDDGPRHRFFPCCHSRAQISSDLFRRRISIYLPYLHTCFVVPTSRRRRRRRQRRRYAQLNTIRSVFCFLLFHYPSLFFPPFISLISRSPRARDRSTYTMPLALFAEPLLLKLSFRVIV